MYTSCHTTRTYGSWLFCDQWIHWIYWFRYSDMYRIPHFGYVNALHFSFSFDWTVSQLSFVIIFFPFSSYLHSSYRIWVQFDKKSIRYIGRETMKLLIYYSFSINIIFKHIRTASMIEVLVTSNYTPRSRFIQNYCRYYCLWKYE